MDSIRLHNIELWTRIGVPDEERATPQRLLVSVELLGPTKATGTSDDITKGIDYAEVLAAIQKLAETERKTVERFAEDIAEAILKEFKPNGVQVSIEKNPPLKGIESVRITISRP